MNIQTGRKGESAADNFTTLTFNQQVLDRSVIKGYFTNRTAFQNETEKAMIDLGHSEETVVWNYHTHQNQVWCRPGQAGISV